MHKDGLYSLTLHLILILLHVCCLSAFLLVTFDAVYVGTSKEGMAVMEEAQKLISDGLESRLQSVLEDLLSASPPENMVSSCIRW